MKYIGENLFPGDTYDTPETNRARLGSKIFGRWYFYWHNFNIFSQTGRCGQRGELDGNAQIFYSNQNFQLIERCGGRAHIRGLDILRKHKGPAVYLGNHMSLLETAVLHAILRPHHDFTFVIKESLMKIPHFRDIMTATRAITIGRSNPKEDLKIVLTEGKERLESGQSVMIFPQGTRTAVFDPAHFSSIGVKLAKTAGVPVIPVALKTDFLGNGKIIRDLGPMHPEKDVWFAFGEPMEITGNGKDQQQQVVDFIQKNLESWNK